MGDFMVLFYLLAIAYFAVQLERINLTLIKINKNIKTYLEKDSNSRSSEDVSKT